MKINVPNNICLNLSQERVIKIFLEVEETEEALISRERSNTIEQYSPRSVTFEPKVLSEPDKDFEGLDDVLDDLFEPDEEANLEKNTPPKEASGIVAQDATSEKSHKRSDQ